MRYLFFDTESANSFNSIHKLCEFGYVLTDTAFTILAKKDIVINPGKGPGNQFSLTGRKNREDCILSHDENEYYSAKEYRDYQENIRFLLTQKDLLIFGFALQNDIVPLIQANRRYELPSFGFTGYDVQRYLSQYKDGSCQKYGLEESFLALLGEDALKGITPHNPRDDALMTMGILKAICENLGLSVEELQTLVPEAAISEEDIEKNHIDSQGRILKMRAIRGGFSNEEDYEKVDREFNSYYERKVEGSENTPWKGTPYALSGEIKKNVSAALPLVKKLYEKGGILVRPLSIAKYMVCADEADILRLKAILHDPMPEFVKIKDLDFLPALMDKQRLENK